MFQYKTPVYLTLDEGLRLENKMCLLCKNNTDESELLSYLFDRGMTWSICIGARKSAFDNRYVRYLRARRE